MFLTWPTWIFLIQSHSCHRSYHLSLIWIFLVLQHHLVLIVNWRLIWSHSALSSLKRLLTVVHNCLADSSSCWWINDSRLIHLLLLLLLFWLIFHISTFSISFHCFYWMKTINFTLCGNPSFTCTSWVNWISAKNRSCLSLICFNTI
jgi:hypothetical protein